MMSYGMVLLGPLAAAVVLAQTRSWRYAVPALLLGLVAAVTVVVAFGLAGFWWWDSLALTSERMTDGPGWRDRPGWYFLVANPAALAVAVGPATVAALPWLWRARREPGLPAIAGAALLAVAVATVSQLSRGEVGASTCRSPSGCCRSRRCCPSGNGEGGSSPS
jgi:hypothetical protein